MYIPRIGSGAAAAIGRMLPSESSKRRGLYRRPRRRTAAEGQGPVSVCADCSGYKILSTEIESLMRGIENLADCVRCHRDRS